MSRITEDFFMYPHIDPRPHQHNEPAGEDQNFVEDIVGGPLSQTAVRLRCPSDGTPLYLHTYRPLLPPTGARPCYVRPGECVTRSNLAPFLRLKAPSSLPCVRWREGERICPRSAERRVGKKVVRTC